MSGRRRITVERDCLISSMSRRLTAGMRNTLKPSAYRFNNLFFERGLRRHDRAAITHYILQSCEAILFQYNLEVLKKSARRNILEALNGTTKRFANRALPGL